MTRQKSAFFDDYEAFINKFKPKKTTDDCYTPKKVYEVVLNYVRQKCDLKGMEVVRPFYPGGDYENFEYIENDVVIDNPPFSIFSKIIRFYLKRNIKFFLFAPHLTLFQPCKQDCTAIVAGCDITYENGAKVLTSFVSNMFGNIKITTAPDLFEELQKLNKNKRKSLPKYKYPDEVLTVSKLNYLAQRGQEIILYKNQVHWIRRLVHQKAFKKAIFGGGFLTSKAAAEKIAAAKAAASVNAAAKSNIEATGDVVEWKLSAEEEEIVEYL